MSVSADGLFNGRPTKAKRDEREAMNDRPGPFNLMLIFSADVESVFVPMGIGELAGREIDIQHRTIAQTTTQEQDRS